MSKRFDVMSPRAGREEGKTFWHRVGTAFEGEKGLSVKLDSLPLPDAKGEVWLKLFEPREKQERKAPDDINPPMGNAPQAPRAGLKRDMDDDIPFEMDWR